MRLMQKELEELKEARQREARQAHEDREELIRFRDRCDKLEEENESRQGGVIILFLHLPFRQMKTEPFTKADPEVVEQLRAEMEGLLMEINELSRRNDELVTSKESDNVLIRDLDNQLKDYKRKYEQAKTELRSVKGVSS
jgi:FtsZ-binding cell division protein ZapB